MFHKKCLPSITMGSMYSFLLTWLVAALYLLNTCNCMELLEPVMMSTNSSLAPQTNHSKVNLRVEQFPQMLAFMFYDKPFQVNYTIVCDDPTSFYVLKIVTDDVYVAFIKNNATVILSCDPEATNTTVENLQTKSGEYELSGSFNLLMGTDLLGRTWLYFNLVSDGYTPPLNRSHIDEETPILPKNNAKLHYSDSERLMRILVVVLKPMRTLDMIFRVIIYFVIISSTVGMGCKTDLNVVKTVLKKPIAPGIGFGCQYICMPLIAFGIAKSIKFENPAVALGIFACGICPGGGISNIYCYVLNGDVSLSVTMTTISTIAALGMIPLWMFTLGSLFNDEKTTINIPYANIMSTLAMVIIPLFVGMIIKYKCLKVAKIILKVIKPLSLITIVILLTFGIYVNLYIFRLFKPLHILAGCLLPYFGYLVGGVVALIFRQPWARVKTIAIETGIQNVGVAFLMLLTSLPPPDGDLAAVGPAASGIMTPLPLFVISIAYVIYNKIKAKYHPVSTEPDTVKEKEKPAMEVNGNGVKTAKEIIINENVSTV